jgi:hypothetical protein
MFLHASFADLCGVDMNLASWGFFAPIIPTTQLRSKKVGTGKKKKKSHWKILPCEFAEREERSWQCPLGQERWKAWHFESWGLQVDRAEARAEGKGCLGQGPEVSMDLGMGQEGAGRRANPEPSRQSSTSVLNMELRCEMKSSSSSSWTIALVGHHKAV